MSYLRHCRDSHASSAASRYHRPGGGKPPTAADHEATKYRQDPTNAAPIIIMQQMIPVSQDASWSIWCSGDLFYCCQNR